MHGFAYGNAIFCIAVCKKLHCPMQEIAPPCAKNCTPVCKKLHCRMQKIARLCAKRFTSLKNKQAKVGLQFQCPTEKAAYPLNEKGYAATSLSIIKNLQESGDEYI